MGTSDNRRSTPAWADLSWTSIATGTTAVIHILQLAFLARVLSASELGLIALANVVIALGMMLSDCGISNYLIHRGETSREEQSSLYWLNVMLGFTASLLVIVAAPLVSRYYGAPELQHLLLLSALIYPVIAAGIPLRAQLARRLALSTIGRVETASRVAGAIVVVVTALQGQGAASYIYGQLAFAVGQTVMLGIATRGFAWPQIHFNFSAAAAGLRFGLLTSAGQLLNRLASDFDTLLIGRFLGVDTLGVYSLAKELTFGVLRVLTTLISRVGIPLLAARQRQETALVATFTEVLTLSGLIALVGFTGFALVSPVLAPALYGPRGEALAPLILLLAMIGILRSMGTVNGVLIIATGRAQLDLRWNLIVLALTVPLVLYGVSASLHTMLCALVGLQLLLMLLAYPVLIRPVVALAWQDYLGCLIVPVTGILVTVLLSGTVLQLNPALLIGLGIGWCCLGGFFIYRRLNGFMLAGQAG